MNGAPPNASDVRATVVLWAGLAGMAGLFAGATGGAVAGLSFAQSVKLGEQRDWRNSYAKLKERYRVMAQLSAKEIDQLRAGVKAKDSCIASKQVEIADLRSESLADRERLAKLAAELDELKRASASGR